MKRMALIFLLFFSGLSAGAQYFPIHENDFILLKGVKYTLNRMTRESKNRDTTYLWLAPPELKIKLSYNFQEAGMKLDWDFKYDEDVTDLEGHTTMETVPGRVRSDLLGNLTKYMGLKFSYAGVSFGMSIWKDKSKKHKNKSFSFGYKKGHWMFDFKYLKTRGNIGYRIITGDDPSSIHYSNNEYESEYDCRMKYYQFDAYYAINYLNQVFANTIRSNGLGHNDERCLMVTGYAAQSSSNIMKSITLPTYKGKTVNNLIISLHSYTPYEFCLTDKKKTFSLTSSSDIGNVKAVFRDIHDAFLRYGIPVIMGETGATNSGNNKDARVNWAYYTSKMAAYYGIPIILWDNGAGGSSGGECHQYINRRANNSITFPEFFEALHRGQEEATRGGYVNLIDSPFPVNAATDGRAAFTSLTPYKTSLTPAALPVIEPRDTRPTPTPSPTPTPTETPTVTPTAAPTEAAPTESAVTVTPTPGAATDGESSTNMLAVIGAILGLIGCAFIVGFGFYLIFRGFKKR